mmetsp:Transcript_45629/g.138649  ORF Transcript_45629/g.138649 Transcript_45629/m.138649 type:complete len:186 (-) Transcript_45629:139-696(-)|eukprot:CAMPEP_0113581774 /NCGR_PEP_ID=MMETSP0015_2-20120614/31506_1 /TAXON_ID=2838 /ORGANISM="Odontella" /LENGTH=185 /DNA_ID=CAMNT_0000486293 /DNA_START=83 /DNA_END=640 /DNA_ORIENTATION=+ /assembly_acc=CAM_ASM_000160
MVSKRDSRGNKGEWNEDYGLGEEAQVALNDVGGGSKENSGSTDEQPKMARVGSCAAVMGGAGGDVQVGRCNSYALFRGSEDEKGLAAAADAARKADALFLDEGDASDEPEVVVAHRKHPAPGDGVPIGSHGGDVQIGRKDSLVLFRGDSCGPSDFAKGAIEIRQEDGLRPSNRRDSEDSLGAIQF